MRFSGAGSGHPRDEQVVAELVVVGAVCDIGVRHDFHVIDRNAVGKLTLYIDDFDAVLGAFLHAARHFVLIDDENAPPLFQAGAVSDLRLERRIVGVIAVCVDMLNGKDRAGHDDQQHQRG